MIEIGNERTFESGARRAARAFGNVALLLFLVWLARGYLFLSGYSLYLLAGAFGLIFLGRALRTRTSNGVARAVSSFMGNITLACLMVLILIWIFGWIAGIQQDVLPARFTQQVPNLVIALVAAALISIAASTLAAKVKGPSARGPAILVSPSSGLSSSKVRLSAKKDSVVLPVRESGRTLGAVVLGDVSATFETPMGEVTGSFPGPVTTMGVPFRGEKADGQTISKLTGKTLGQLLGETHVDTTIPRGEIFASGFSGNLFEEERVDLPFVSIRKTSTGQSVKVGPISVTTGGEGEEDVEVGPFSFNPCDWDSEREGKVRWFGKDKQSRWLVKGSRGSSYLSASPDGTQARWNGSALRISGDSMKMAVGSDGFVYTPTELETYSPLHALHVTQSKATLNTKNFTLNVSGDRVLLRAEEGSKKTESAGLAKDLRDLLTDIANKQVKAVMEGEPMELDEMLARTEGVLKKYE